MDPITGQKLRAMKMNSYKRKHNFRFIYNLILQLLIALACALVCSYSLWLPFVKQSLFTSLPSVTSHVLRPKCLFVVVNVIVVALVGESRLSGSNKPSPSHEVYDEYVRRSWSRSLVGKPTVVSSVRKEVIEDVLGKDLVVRRVDEEKKMEEQVNDEEKGFRGDEIVESVKEKEEEEEVVYELPKEELNRRVEEFIERVNRQRWLEARSLMNFPGKHASPASLSVHNLVNYRESMHFRSD